MKEGTIFFDSGLNRMNICFYDGSEYGGLHCGETFDVLLNGQWIPARIEKADDWYLVGVAASQLIGLTVRK